MKGLVTLTIILALTGCGRIKKGSSCDLTASNLRAEPWTGDSLPDQTLSLMFLRGPSETTADIGSFLEEQGIQGSFFVRGASAVEHENTLHQLREQGHLIGNAGYTFTQLTHSSEALMEVRKTDAVITEAVTGNMFLLHAPDGAFNEEVAHLLNSNGLGKYIGPVAADTLASENFQEDVGCWENGISVSSCASQYFTEIVRIKKGIVAFHDDVSESLELLASLIPDLKAFGFRFARLDAIPVLRAALEEAGGTVDQVAGDASCDDYE